jgi:AraC-like DNA-binding protein
MGLSITNRNDSRGFRRTTAGIEKLPDSFDLPRHRHLRAYATVVLAGCFEESGYAGRITARAGDVLIHPTLDCHQNKMVSAGVTLIRFDWPDGSSFGGLYQLADVDEIAHAAEKDMVEATFLLQRALRKCNTSPREKNDWPDLLLKQLAANASTGLGSWAETNGLSREELSRGFMAAYGTPPSVLRAELRTRDAWLRIMHGSESLASVAAQTGFADQAHMTRWVHRVTGAPPAAWRRPAAHISGAVRTRMAGGSST